MIKLKGLVEGSVMEMNMFAFNMIDGDQDGILLGNDIADINNCLKYCPPVSTDYPMEKLDGCASIANYSTLDKRCKCAFSQELMAIFIRYYELNLKDTLRVKGRITMDKFQHIVKLSCLAVEFKDKLLQRKQYPRLLGHSMQSPDGTVKPLTSHENVLAQREIAAFIK